MILGVSFQLTGFFLSVFCQESVYGQSDDRVVNYREGQESKLFYRLIVLVIGSYINNCPGDLERDLGCFNSHRGRHPNRCSYNHGSATL